MSRGTTAWLVGVGLLAAACSGASAAGRSATFDVTAVENRPGVQVTSNSKVWVTENQARADVDKPGTSGKITLMVSNGYIYQVDFNAKKYARQPAPADWKKKDAFDVLLSRFAFDASKAIDHTKTVRTETIQGYLCDVKEGSETKGPATLNLTLWVPQKMDPKIPLKVVRKLKVTEKGETQEQTTTVTLANLKLNQPIPASTFAIPKDFKLVQPPAPKQGAGRGKKK